MREEESKMYKLRDENLNISNSLVSDLSRNAVFMNDFSTESFPVVSFLNPKAAVSVNLQKHFHVSSDTTDDLQSANEGKC